MWKGVLQLNFTKILSAQELDNRYCEDQLLGNRILAREYGSARQTYRLVSYRVQRKHGRITYCLQEVQNVWN